MGETQIIQELVKQLTSAATTFDSTESEASRVEILDHARSIVSALDKPEDALLKLTFQVINSLHLNNPLFIGGYMYALAEF